MGMRATLLTIGLAVLVSAFASSIAGADSTLAGSKGSGKEPTVASDTLTDKAKAKHQLIVYYFHGNQRCANCIKIEAYTKETVDSTFASQLKDSTVVWRLVNTDEDANKHFREDFQLFTKSVVLSDLADGKQIRWKNLDKIWEYLGDKAAFQAYVRDEVASYLKAE